MTPIDKFKLVITVALLYGYLYSLMDPEEFGFKTALDPYYFSFTTMSSVGYGDFSPITGRAKMLAMTQQAFIFGELLKVLIKEIFK
jgi:voltage-gated potassium channel